MAVLKFFLKELEDKFIRENFYRLDKFLREDALKKAEFSFFELVVLGTVVNKKFAHNLSFKPTDVILLSITKPDSATVTWHYDKFDRESVEISTSGPCTIRAFLGRYSDS